jgi:RimJ/RimL family protein N-acetyltransferase
MKTVVYNLPSVVKFVNERIPGGTSFDTSDPCIGMLEDGKLIAGVVFNMYMGNGIMLHVAADKPGWLNREFLRATFAYPFKQLKCARVTGLVRTDNKDAQRFDEHLGFKKEGVIRKGDDDGCDLIIYGMLKEECRWLDI